MTDTGIGRTAGTTAGITNDTTETTDATGNGATGIAGNDTAGNTPDGASIPGIPSLLTQDELREVIGHRHHLHRHPERSLEETATSAYIADVLRAHGIEPLRTSLETGVVARIAGGKPGPTVALRADIDALPVQEESAFPEPSENPGTMHACGHDLHAASLIGAAIALGHIRERIAGDIILVFQPAEEVGRGARAVVASGALDDAEAVIGFHNNPHLPVGVVAVGPGALMAGCVRFKVTLHAEGTHAAHPEDGTGPMEALATLMLAAQTIVSRNISAFHSAVLSITHVFGGDVWNVIPADAGFEGTVRVFDPGDLRTIERRFRALVEGTATAYGIRADVLWESPGTGKADTGTPLVNDTPLARAVAAKVPGYARLEAPHPSMVGEDFSIYGLDGRRLVFAFVGSNGAPDAANWHSPEFLGLDGTLRYGVEYFASATLTVLDELRGQAPRG